MRLFTLVAVFSVIFFTGCKKEKKNNQNSLNTDCLVGNWIEKFPSSEFTKKLEFKSDNTGIHYIKADSVRNFSWMFEENNPKIVYSDNNHFWYFLLDCELLELTHHGKYVKSNGNNSETGINTPNMKVIINSGTPIDVTATVDCSVIGGHQQLLITGRGTGLGAINLYFRGVTAASGNHTLFYNMDNHTCINAEFVVGSDANIVRGHSFNNDCCGGGTISISEKTSGKIKGSFDIVNGEGTFHLTGDFDISITDNDCN
jgi:hypothetical protein